MNKFTAILGGFLFFLSACSQSGEDRGAYSKNGGGSMEGAGGAGPGYDGTGHGRGKYGTVPDSGASDRGTTGNTQTNSAMPNGSREKPQSAR